MSLRTFNNIGLNIDNGLKCHLNWETKWIDHLSISTLFAAFSLSWIGLFCFIERIRQESIEQLCCWCMLVFFFKNEIHFVQLWRKKETNALCKTNTEGTHGADSRYSYAISRSFFETDTFASIVSTVDLRIGEKVNTCTLFKEICYAQVITVNEEDTIKLRAIV